MKDIKGYEGLYAITSCGKVWSYKSQKFLSQRKNHDGYLLVNLYKNGTMKAYSVHRLVAEAYIPNPENKTEINHKDENKEHNWLSNLEWTTHKENVNHGTRNTRASKKTFAPVYCIELDKTFSSATEAMRQLGIYSANISKCCKGQLKTCGGYHWRYVQ